MSKKKTNASCTKFFFKFLIFFLASLAIISIVSCQDQKDHHVMEEGSLPDETSSLDLFDYKSILIKNTSSIGTKIKNCNIYIDIYGDLVFLGELENISTIIKTDVEITIDFLNSNNDPIHSVIVSVPVNYLRSGAKYPFHYYFTEREKYIDLSIIKTGVNYRQHHKDFVGNPIVEAENYFYEDNYLIIEGRVVNLGKEKIKNVKLLCTFYDKRDRIVFIKECYLTRERMMPSEEQKFQLIILLDQYLKEFTHYNFEIFFEDGIKMPA
ncbi:MAG TPA: hypothetical protein DCP02_01855 [Actinobacteria bacterium]|nr:hypothetical protein [Actinomycetota bacterium]